MESSRDGARLQATSCCAQHAVLRRLAGAGMRGTGDTSSHEFCAANGGLRPAPGRAQKAADVSPALTPCVQLQSCCQLSCSHERGGDCIFLLLFALPCWPPSLPCAVGASGRDRLQTHPEAPVPDQGGVAAQCEAIDLTGFDMLVLAGS